MNFISLIIFTNIIKREASKAFYKILAEKEEGKYYFTVEKNNDESYTITNTYEPLTTSVTVTKVWADDDNEEGIEIEYSVIEEDVPTGYEVSYEGNMEEGFVVHNIKGQGDIDPPPYNNPQTGDNIMPYLITLLVSIIGLISGKIYLRKSDI